MPPATLSAARGTVLLHVVTAVRQDPDLGLAWVRALGQPGGRAGGRFRRLVPRQAPGSPPHISPSWLRSRRASACASRWATF